MLRASTVAVLLFASLSARAEPERVIEVRRGDLNVYYRAEGVFRARRTARLASLVPGRVDRVAVNEGDRVRQGDILVRLDPGSYEVEFRLREAGLKAADVAREGARARLRRAEDLLKTQEGTGSLVTEQEVEQARFAVELAEADFQQAEASLRATDLRLKETQILAPFDGVVTKRFVDQGDVVTVTPAVTLLEIKQIDQPDLEFSLSQALADRVRLGMELEFIVDGAEALIGRGQVSMVSPEIDEATRTIRCRAACREGGTPVRPGLCVSVRVLGEVKRGVLVLPRAALIRAKGGWEVNVVDGKVSTRRPVKLGAESEEGIEIVEGLSDGDRVVIPESK